VPTYWSKDDHDFRYNDSDNETDRLPLSKTGIDIFHEQVPIAPAGAKDPKSYRTIRVSRDLQIWLTEGRDYRSSNTAPDGPEKTMWGKTQRQWLKSTLSTSDAKWKLIISPTPMVGPDIAKKQDNHASLSGFRHEANEFFEWTKKQKLNNLFLICGDRHWQYHSIHPSGINEFAMPKSNSLLFRQNQAADSSRSKRVNHLFSTSTMTKQKSSMALYFLNKQRNKIQ